MEPTTSRAGVWGIVDQVLSSGTNLLLPLVGLASLSVAAADRLSVLLAATFLLVGVSRGAVGESFTVYASRQDRAVVGDLRRAFVAFAMACGAVGGAVIGAIGVWYLHAPVAALGMAVTTMFVLVQDACRYIMFETNAARSAAANDLIWLSLFATLCLLSVVRGSVQNLFLAWSGCGALCAVVAFAQLRLRPSLSALRRHRVGSVRLVCGLGAEYVVTLGVAQVFMVLVGLYGAAGDGARYRLATTLLTPAGVVAGGLAVSLQAQIIGSVERTRRHQLVRWLWGLSAVAVVLCWLLVLVVPSAWGLSLFGPVFQTSKPVVLCLAVAGVAQSGALAWNMHIRADRLIRRSLAARATLGLIALAFAGWLAPRSGAIGTSALYASFSWAVLASLVWIVRRRRAESSGPTLSLAP